MVPRLSITSTTNPQTVECATESGWDRATPFLHIGLIITTHPHYVYISRRLNTTNPTATIRIQLQAHHRCTLAYLIAGRVLF